MRGWGRWRLNPAEEGQEACGDWATLQGCCPSPPASPPVGPGPEGMSHSRAHALQGTTSASPTGGQLRFGYKRHTSLPARPQNHWLHPRAGGPAHSSAIGRSSASSCPAFIMGGGLLRVWRGVPALRGRQRALLSRPAGTPTCPSASSPRRLQSFTGEEPSPAGRGGGGEGGWAGCGAEGQKCSLDLS